MPRCPHCYYGLVLLSHRRKYKCAKCGKIFFQKSIEDREFQRWNQLEREQGRSHLFQELHQTAAVRQEQKALRAFRFIFTDTIKRERVLPEERRERQLERKRQWRESHHEKVLAMNRAWLSKNKDKRIAYLKQWRKTKPNVSRLKQRLAYWRQQQLKLAQQEMLFDAQTPYFDDPEDSFSTFGLSELLSRSQN